MKVPHLPHLFTYYLFMVIWTHGFLRVIIQSHHAFHCLTCFHLGHWELLDTGIWLEFDCRWQREIVLQNMKSSNALRVQERMESPFKSTGLSAGQPSARPWANGRAAERVTWNKFLPSSFSWPEGQPHRWLSLAQGSWNCMFLCVQQKRGRTCRCARCCDGDTRAGTWRHLPAV